MAGLPRLFESTKVLPDLDQSGLSDAPHPDEIPFAAPDLDGVASDSATATDGLPASEPAKDEAPDAATMDDVAVDPTKPADLAADTKPTRKAIEYADGEPTVDEADTQPAEAPAASDGFTDELLKRAESYGYDAESARRFGAADNLTWALAQEDLRRAQWGQEQLLAAAAQQAAAQQQAQQQPAVTQQSQQAQPTQQQQQAAASALKKYELDREKLTAAGYDDDTIELLTGMNEHYYQQFTALANETEQVKQVAAQRNTGQSQADAQAQYANFERDMDAFFDSLGDAWKEEFGSGPMRNLSGAAYDNRFKIAEVVGGLVVADALSNQPQNEPVASLAQRALTALHFKKQKDLALRETAAKVKDRRSQSIARPGGQQHRAPLAGRDRALRRADQFYAARPV